MHTLDCISYMFLSVPLVTPIFLVYARVMYVSSESGLDEKTPLVSSRVTTHSSGLTSSAFVNSRTPVKELDYVTERYLRSVFRVGGLTICVVDVTIVSDSRLSRCFPRFFPPQRYCDGAVALMREGGLHVIADVDSVTGSHLLRGITGKALCAAGTVLANGIPVEAGVFRKAVGIITDVETYMPNLTVGENINFVVSMRTRVTGEFKKTLVDAVCLLTGLNRHKSSKSLSSSEAFRLRLAMEIVRDPPVIVAHYPLDHLGPNDSAECSVVLKRVSTILEKTVIISSSTLPAHLYQITDTLLLFGSKGRILYSGEAATMPLYFNSLCGSLNRPIHSHSNISSQCSNIGYNNSISPFCVSDTTLSMRESNFIENDERRDSSLSSFRIEEARAPTSNTPVVCGDDALDIASLWAGSESVTDFYSSKFFESRLRRRVLQAIMRCSNPPQSVKDVAMFTNITSPQYSVLKPILLCWYDAMQTWRSSEFFVHFACLLLGVLVISLMMNHQNDDQGGMYNIRGIQFVLFLLIMLSNATVMGDMNYQLRLFLYQRNNELYSTFCFMITFVLRTFFIWSLFVALILPVVIYVLKMKATFLLLVGTLSITQVFLHVTVHAFLCNRWASIILALYLGYSVIFSGFLLNLKTIPPFVGKMSLLRWGYGAALSQSLRDMPFSCDGAGNTSYCYSGNTYLDIEGFLGESTARSMLVFSVMSGVLIILMGIALACRE